MSSLLNKFKIVFPVVLLMCFSFTVFAAAPTAKETNATMFDLNTLWILIATFLVFIMHLGFAMLEAGLARAKNTVNILFKNTLIPAIGLLTYAVIGYSIMYSGSWILDGIFSFGGLGFDLKTSADAPFAKCADFIFQGMFAATAATIVSGAVAERVKLGPFLIFSTVFVAIFYAISGSWIWCDGGWLKKLGFLDFAGSTAVHSVGGWAALAGVILLGPRTGKYVNGTSKPIMGHNIPMATMGVFLLWFGWFGFNGGSVLSADPEKVSYVFVTTSLAAAAGIIGSMAASWIIQKKPDLTMVLNGCLAGLVGVTASADIVSNCGAILVGVICGIVVVVAVLAIDHMKLDDPVGALSVHLVCGVIGTLWVGFFSESGMLIQIYGVLAVGALSFSAAFIIFFILKKTVGIRVDEEEEMRGLDIGEHGIEAYNGFQIFNNQ